MSPRGKTYEQQADLPHLNGTTSREILFAGGAKDHLPKTPRRIVAASANTMLIDDAVAIP